MVTFPEARDEAMVYRVLITMKKNIRSILKETMYAVRSLLDPTIKDHVHSVPIIVKGNADKRYHSQQRRVLFIAYCSQ
jgi:hypothetical protein